MASQPLGIIVQFWCRPLCPQPFQSRSHNWCPPVFPSPPVEISVSGAKSNGGYGMMTGIPCVLARVASQKSDSQSHTGRGKVQGGGWGSALGKFASGKCATHPDSIPKLWSKSLTCKFRILARARAQKIRWKILLHPPLLPINLPQANLPQANNKQQQPFHRSGM